MTGKSSQGITRGYPLKTSIGFSLETTGSAGYPDDMTADTGLLVRSRRGCMPAQYVSTKALQELGLNFSHLIVNREFMRHNPLDWPEVGPW